MPPRSRADPALGRVLRSLREERRHTQETLAHEAGLTVASLARIERGQANPTWTTVRSIATALDVSLADLGRAVDQAGPSDLSRSTPRRRKP
jgi:transcriptional regulator with XRE-family HTH domain